MSSKLKLIGKWVCVSKEQYPGQEMRESLESARDEQIYDLAEELDIVVECAFDKEEVIDLIIKRFYP